MQSVLQLSTTSYKKLTKKDTGEDIEGRTANLEVQVNIEKEIKKNLIQKH